MPHPPVADSQNMLPVGTRIGEFEITALIGEGGFGIVYLAFDHALQRQVALKEYIPASLALRERDGSVLVRSSRDQETFQAGLRSFVNEARLLAQFDHPALVKVHRFWEGNGTAYMVMPFYEGITLKDTLKRMGQPPSEEWLTTLLGPLLDALTFIHGRQCFHRDIAPDNIMILNEGGPVLLDFGAARRVISDRNQVLTVILKPGYAPVEQYADVAGMKQGAWTDIYALAAVIYFAATGRTPLPSVARLVSDGLVPLSQAAHGRYSPVFLAGIDRALSLQPEQRPQSVPEFRIAIGMGDPANGTPTPMIVSPAVAVAAMAPDPFGDTIPQAVPSQALAAGRLPPPPPRVEPVPPAAPASVWPVPLPAPGGSEAVQPRVRSAALALAPASGRKKGGLLVSGALASILVLAGMAYVWMRGAQHPPPIPAVNAMTPDSSASSPPSQQSAPPSPSPSVETPAPSGTVATPLPLPQASGSAMPAAAEGPAATLGDAQPAALATAVTTPKAPRARAQGGAPTRKALPPPEEASPRMSAAAPQCADLLQRASLGEPLTADEKALLKRSCR